VSEDVLTDAPPTGAEKLWRAMERCRAGTLALFEGVDDAAFRRQAHADFSPIGWHLGHIAYTEAHWLVRHCGGQSLPFPELERVFHVELTDKQERTGVPPYDEVAAYAASVRAAARRCLGAGAAAGPALPVWHFVLQHECQHAETISFVKYLAAGDGRQPAVPAFAPLGPETLRLADMPGGPVTLGHDGPAAMDNEKPVHGRTIPAYRLGTAPVSQAQFAAFMADGGYSDARWWCAAGLAWKAAQQPEQPLYWRADAGAAALPVMGVSAWEADAFCRWAAARAGTPFRLPAEPEWEAAALAGPRAGDALEAGGPQPVDIAAEIPAHLFGNVWEWTGSVFHGYPGFVAWPYQGYSQAYFDGRHRVLRGGSWATRRAAMRPSWRNWYHPWTRQVLAGFRVAADSS